MLEIFNEDCMELMSRYPDGYFDLAIVDPPYGGGVSRTAQSQRDDSPSIRRTLRPIPGSPGRFGGRFDKYRNSKKKKTIHATGGRFAKYDKQEGGGSLSDGRNMGVEVWRRH